MTGINTNNFNKYNDYRKEYPGSKFEHRGRKILYNETGANGEWIEWQHATP
jgi:hypothetical protein